jgi:hypothetical protein
MCQTSFGYILILMTDLLPRRVLKKSKEAAWGALRGALPWEMRAGDVIAFASRLFRRTSRASEGWGFCICWCTYAVLDLTTQVSRRSGGGRCESFKEELLEF